MKVHFPLIIFTALGFLGCSGGHSVRTNAPNVILIVMDTARADHFSCYGYTRPTSPRIDAFSEQAVYYARAMASSPWTLPTHASLFTGMDPFEHGVHTLRRDKRTQRYADANPLRDESTTLAEVLRDAGYATAAFCANDVYLSPRWKLDQGFDTYFVENMWADKMNQHVYAWLDAVSKEPFFLFINYMDTHKPYNATPRPGFLEPPAVLDDGKMATTFLESVMLSDDPFPHELQRKVIDQYDTAIANLDASIGELLDDLKRRGLYDNSIIVVTSDHGEALGEHDLVGHGMDVYQPLLWVPLVVKTPGVQEAARIDAPFALADIPRLILSALPTSVVRAPEDAFPNHAGDHPVISQNYYSRERFLEHPVYQKRYDRIRTVVFDWPHKYIFSTDGNDELYELATDAGEAIDLIDNDPDIAQRLLDMLLEYRAQRPESVDIIDQPPMTEKELERLRALGYLGK